MQSTPKFKNADDFREKKKRNETKTMFPLSTFFVNKYAVTTVPRGVGRGILRRILGSDPGSVSDQKM